MDTSALIKLVSTLVQTSITNGCPHTCRKHSVTLVFVPRLLKCNVTTHNCPQLKTYIKGLFACDHSFIHQAKG